MKKVLAFGDYLVHFSPPGYQRFAQATMMDMTFTGAEANVCAALSYRGIPTEFVTSLPDNALARRGVSFLRGLGIGVDHIRYGGRRMGLYFLEKGASVRSSEVIYDREHTSFCESSATDYDWKVIFEDVGVFYLTGITPMLSTSLGECCRTALQIAKEKGVLVFFDLNYRSRLGTVEMFRDLLLNIARYVDVLIINEEHAKMLFDLQSNFGEEESQARLTDLTKKVQECTGIPTVAMPVRRTLSASDTRIYAGLLREDGMAMSDSYRIHVVDRVGGGDAFSAGLLEAWLKGYSMSDTVNFAIASSALKHTVESDINFSTTDEAWALVKGKSGDVRR